MNTEDINSVIITSNIVILECQLRDILRDNKDPWIPQQKIENEVREAIRQLNMSIKYD